MEVLVGLALLILSIATRVSLGEAKRRIDALDRTTERQRELIDELGATIRGLQRLAKSPAAAPPPEPVAVPTTAPIPSTPPVVSLPAEKPPAPTPPPAPPPPRRPVVTVAEPPPQPIEEPAAASIPKAPAFDWESLIGVKLFAAVAGVALLVGAIFFLAYSVEHGWLEPPVRVAIGIIVAVALLIVCELKTARQYPATANAMDGSAIGILFSTFFAAHALWDLIALTPTFLLMGLVTAVAVVLSVRRNSLFIAVLGLLGGFLTPAVLSTGENRPIELFSYLLLLNVGLAWVAYRKRWPLLTALSAALTTLYQWGWVVKFLHESSLLLAMGVFLVFPAVALAGLALNDRRRLEQDDASPKFEVTGLLATALPLTFGIYLAAIPAYGAQTSLLFGFVGLIDIGLFAVALARREEQLHLLGGASTLLTVGLWLGLSYTASALHTGIICLTLLGAFYGLAPSIADAVRRPLAIDGRRATIAGPLLLFAFVELAYRQEAESSQMLLFGSLFGLAALHAWRAITSRIGGVYFTAAFFVLATLATWSARHLGDDTLTLSMVLYAAFGLFALAVPVMARRVGRPFEPPQGPAVVLIAGLGLLLFLALGPSAPTAIWGFAILLSILNAAIFVESAAGRLPLIALVGGGLSWLVLAAWWSRAAAIVGVLPALLLVVLLALVMLGGHAWAHRLARDGGSAETHRDPAQPRFRDGLFLALVAHGFFFAVAANPAWAVPPWPLFAAMAVVTLAMSVVALATGAGALHAAGAAAAAIVVAQWSAATVPAPWPLTPLVAAAVVSGYGLVWMSVFAQRGVTGEAVPIGAAVALVAGEITAILAAQPSGNPGTVPLVIAHVLNLSLLLALAWRRRWPWFATGAVLAAWMALISFQTWHPGADAWGALLALSAAIYAVFAVYPFVVDRRAHHSRDPHLALILASGVALLSAREALLRAGLGIYVGAVPVIESLVLAAVLRQLLRTAPGEEPETGRLALVAGAALAFLTVAIPLQLSRQWITVGWALEGAALAWLATRIPHRGLVYAAAGLLGAVFVRLALNPAVLYYEPRGAMRILNWYLYAYGVSAVALIAAGTWARGPIAALKLPDFSKWLHAGGVILFFLLLNLEIADYFSDGPDITFQFAAGLAQDLTYTISWSVFGIVLLVAGIITRSHAARIAALALIAVTTFKGFLFDLRTLGGLYRVGAFVGLAISLALVSVLLQRFVLAPAKAAREQEAQP